MTQPGPVVGILGGIGPASTRLYYDLLLREGRRRWGTVPEVVLYCLNFDRFTEFENGDRAAYVDEIARGLAALEDAGAQVLGMSANSPHTVWDEVVRSRKRPLVDIVDAVARRARARGLRRLLVLGIPHTLRSGLYTARMAAQGLAVEAPDPRHHALLEHIVFQELTRGVISSASRRRLADVVGEHPAVDGVVLGCTELPLLIDGGDLDLSVLDSARIHVDAILDAAEAVRGPPAAGGCHA